ncbi:hypothetical protein ACSBR2_030437 [Camellia fascicularis]
MVRTHIVLVSFPTQGALNPTIQFAKNLKRMGVKVTILSGVFAQNRMTKASSQTPDGLTFIAFSDGYDDGLKLSDNQEHFMSEHKRCGSKALPELIMASSEEDCLKICNDPSCAIELPGLGKLTSRDVPTFMLPSNTFSFGLPGFKEQLDALDAEVNPKILVNTFDALESMALRAIGKHNLIAIGPLVPSAFLDGKDPSETAFGGDLLQKSRGYVEWLDSKPQSSVMYISFGSFFNFPLQEMEEIARGLLESNQTFLWVLRDLADGEKQEDKLSCRDELKKQVIIVSWCSQVEVLSHPSVGCFVTHCGWNSSLESDQPTNAKLLEDEYKTGVRATKNEKGVVEADEIKRCIELVMGDGEIGEEIRGNAKKWKYFAKEAAKEGGSSDKNLSAFVDEIEDGF